MTAQNQAKLNFQTSGKLVYLPFKEGDKVTVKLVAIDDRGRLQLSMKAAARELNEKK